MTRPLGKHLQCTWTTLLLVPCVLILLGNDSCSSDGGWDDFPPHTDAAWADSTSDSDWGETDTADTGGPFSEQDSECSPVARIGCGERTHGDSGHPNSGHTTVINGYPIAVGNYSGPEVAWAYHAESSEEVVWRLIDPDATEANHDLFVIHDEDDVCRAGSAIKRGFNELRFDAIAGQTYFLVLDGYYGDEGHFETELDCGTSGETGATNGTPQPSLPGSCAQLQLLWEEDLVDPIARCRSIAQPAVPESTWTGERMPDLSLVSADLCLARSTWTYGGQDYFVFGGQIQDDYAYGGGPRQVHALSFAGSDAENHGLESDESIEIRDVSLGSAFVDDGDLVSEVLYDKLDQSLLFRQGTDAFGPGGWALHYSAQLNCEAL